MAPPTTSDPLTPSGRLLPLTGPATHWPAGVRSAIEPRRLAQLADVDATGSILDLGAGPLPVDDGVTFDTIVSFGALTGFADLPATLAAVRRLLAPDGRFRFIEPVGRPGWTGLVGASVGSHLRVLRADHLGRDVPAAARSAGLLICRLERFTVATRAWPLRDFVDAYAVIHETPIPTPATPTPATPTPATPTPATPTPATPTPATPTPENEPADRPAEGENP